MKKIIALILSLVTLISVLGVIPVSAASLPSISSGSPLITYTYNSSGKVYAYSDTSLKKKTGGYIDCSADECKILKISGNAVQVKYPVSGGTKTAWFKREDFTYRNLASEGAKSTFNAKTSATTYKWKNKSSKLGSISKGDKCYLLRGDDKSDWLQLIYPVSGGHKMGWVKGSDYLAMTKKENNSDSTPTKVPNITPTPSSKEQSISSKLTKMMEGSSYNGVYKLNTRYTGQFYTEQCKGFAKSVHMKLFGYNIGSTKAKPNNYSININSSNTKFVGSVKNINSKTATDDKVKALFSKARPGDFVQMRRTHTGSHSAIVYSVSSTGITFYEANTDGNNTIKKNTYTWEQLRKKNNAMSLYTAKNY